jgi:hypothetical protein
MHIGPATLHKVQQHHYSHKRLTGATAINVRSRFTMHPGPLVKVGFGSSAPPKMLATVHAGTEGVLSEDRAITNKSTERDVMSGD